MNGGSRLSYYNYTVEVVISAILNVDANLFYLIINSLLIYIYICVFCSFIYLFIYLLFRYIICDVRFFFDLVILCRYVYV